MSFDAQANVCILNTLRCEMIKEQTAGGVFPVEECLWSDTHDKSEAEEHIRIMKSFMDGDHFGIFKTLYDKSLTSQYFKAVLLHFRGVDLLTIPFTFVVDESSDA